jgi:hypothetical protein
VELVGFCEQLPGQIRCLQLELQSRVGERHRNIAKQALQMLRAGPPHAISSLEASPDSDCCVKSTIAF